MPVTLDPSRRAVHAARVPEPSPSEIVQRYATAMGAGDKEMLLFVMADDLIEDFPQSGERIIGFDNWMALIEHWPEETRPHLDQVVGSEDRWVSGPNWSLARIEGTGDKFWGAGHVTYPDGSTWHVVQLIELRNGKIAHLTSYFAPPFEAPEWRKPWVVRMPEEEPVRNR